MSERAEEPVSPKSPHPASSIPVVWRGSNGDVPLSSLLTDFANRRSLEPHHSPTYPLTILNGSTSNRPLQEATDYMNGGLSHECPISPVCNGLAATVSSLRQSALKHTNSISHDGHIAGTATPTDWKSVQFARPQQSIELLAVARPDSWIDGETHGETHGETPGNHRRGQSFISKLKALASTGNLQTHIRNQSNVSSHAEEGSVSTPRSPVVDRSVKFPQTLQEESSDADAEETADEDAIVDAVREKKKRRFRRPKHEALGESQTAPTTPRVRVMGQPDPQGANGRAVSFLNRKVVDGSYELRGHVSEGEGQDRMNNQSAWRRGSSWITGSLNNSGSNDLSPQADGGFMSPRRPSNFRRAMSGLGGGLSEGEASTPKRPFLGAERATTFGAQRWRMLKHGLKLLGQRKEEHKVDYLKSAELMAELRAGAPAALMLASMIQRDEHGNKRIPVLLEQLKLRVIDSGPGVEEPSDSERHLVFKIELEYGSGLNRMKWVIDRSLRDFANLHLRYKLQGSSDKYIQLRSDVDARPKQPRFPKSAFPYFRGVRGFGDSDEDEADPARADDTAAEGTHSETDRKGKRKTQSSFSMTRRKSSAISHDPATGGSGDRHVTPKVYNERQRRRLEQYLQEMIRWLIFRADSNRLCRFLELSALGVRLAAEGSYHGKEGYLIIQSAKGLDMRRLLTPKNVFSRHSPKWFLVRHSYIVCVDSPENMQIYDVFLVDPKFEILQKRRKLKELKGKEKRKEIIGKAESAAKHPQHHTLKLINSERKIRLLAKNERQLRQFESSINYMLSSTLWSKEHRFGSFAPVRTGVYAQWLVDGRDYMWNVSRAINMAKDVIYIHDWWLSPQLYMRRPAAISQKWRLDRLLQNKAREGVKIFIIIYRNVEAAIPIDSEFTKFSMLDLHPNVFVQRSPNQFKKNQFFYAHHEKICIVDHTVAFVGGIDLCFGRWDTPQHSVVDDKPTGFEKSDLPKDADHCQLWPGKDYSNPRVQDFFQLNEPYAEMYDRSRTPRMPWHDIAMQVVGQPARDLTRHFVQRWNYVLRGRKPTRPTPFLLPPPDYNAVDLEELGLTGTCEVQILRSASDWSLGLTDTEHSIMTAYCKMIEESEHFVYMENQFFISSCETMNAKIVNKIGDAIVERAIRAHQNNESWRCVILIPLMPGFQNTVEEPEGTSVRLIMQCQFRSICRGEGSIFGRLRSQGIEPEDYVQFYSLRSWGRIGPKKMLVTEQLYIHAKAIIVDDRVALIGSANINERSMLGVRDSECAAVVRDTDMLWSTMDGKPYLVGRFAHTLRMRLMREHLGLDVDHVMEEEHRAEADKDCEEDESQMNSIYDESDSKSHPGKRKGKLRENLQSVPLGFSHMDYEQEHNPNIYPGEHKPIAIDPRIKANAEHPTEVDDAEDQIKPNDNSRTAFGGDLTITDGGCEVSVADNAAKWKITLEQARKAHIRTSHSYSIGNEGKGFGGIPPMPDLRRRTTAQLGLSQLSQLPALPLVDDTDIGGPPVHFDTWGQPTSQNLNPLTADIKPASVHKDCMRDPLNDNFFEDTWRRIADNNTKIFRRVFRCNPDSEVQAWSEYQQFVAYGARFAKEQSGEAKTTETDAQGAPGKSGPPGAALCGVGLAGVQQSHPMGTGEEWAEKASQQNARLHDLQDKNGQINGLGEKYNTTNMDEAVEAGSPPTQPSGDEKFPSFDNNLITSPQEAEKESQTANRKATLSSNPAVTNSPSNGKRRRRNTLTKGSRRTFSASDDVLSTVDCEELLSLVQGVLVNFPYDWLAKEELNSNWLYPVDQVAPLQIYD